MAPLTVDPALGREEVLRSRSLHVQHQPRELIAGPGFEGGGAHTKLAAPAPGHEHACQGQHPVTGRRVRLRTGQQQPQPVKALHPIALLPGPERLCGVLDRARCRFLTVRQGIAQLFQGAVRIVFA